ncbi:MAG: hypothetical protein JWO42_3003 [Chloroflexi bacterium]|jgi:uncharacterized membrane protein YbhN (UPF0104 family)|nr:hypothetical protein [Chloroflexota bacterium]
MSRLFRPSVVLPLIFAVVVIGGLLRFADSKKVVALMSAFPRRDLALYLLLMVCYEFVRGLQWHVLLGILKLRVPLRAQIFSFAVGEISKSLPIGNYFQNYVLQVAEGIDIGRTSAATTLIILIEVAVSLLGVVVLGLGEWTSWLRPLIIIGLLITSIVAVAYAKLHHAHSPPKWMTQSDNMRKLLEELRQFREGVADLLHVRLLIVPVALGAVYLVIAGTALYLIARGLDVRGLTYGETLSVYFLSLAFGLIFPLPVDIGVTEISGVGALLAVGVDRNKAVSLVLLNRVLSIGAAIAIALVVVAILHDELIATLRGRAIPPSEPSAANGAAVGSRRRESNGPDGRHSVDQTRVGGPQAKDHTT